MGRADGRRRALVEQPDEASTKHGRTIAETPPAKTLTAVDVTASVPLRDYRHLIPNGSYGNVAEINFYG